MENKGGDLKDVTWKGKARPKGREQEEMFESSQDSFSDNQQNN